MNRSAHVPARWKTPLAAAALMLAAGLASADDAKKVDFVKDVQPIFKASCLNCHSLDPKKPKKRPAAKFQLDDKAAAFKGGKSGVAIVPGSAKDSLFFKLLIGPVTVPVEDDEKELAPMPKVKRWQKWKPLPADQIATIRRWIDQGADWPDAR